MTMHEVNEELRRTGFWKFNFAQLVVIIGLIGAFMVWWSSFSTLPKETAQALATLSQTVEKINEHNTFAGQLDHQTQIGINSSFDSRLLALEKNYGQLNDNVTEIKTQLKVIATLLEADKSKKK
jgi:uncharacterized protein YukE